MNIRDIVMKDVPELARVEAFCFGQEAWSQEALASSLALPTTRGAVWEDDGQIAGFYLIQKTQDEVEILTLGVHPDYRRQGIGRAMIAHILAQGAGGSVFLDVAQDNIAAQRLYEQSGFTVFSRRAGYYRRETGASDALNYRYNSTQ